ncbi:hypothetical protein QCA50_015141 [Cerrena zonata]|uniref:Maturase K n=1 Tax=Cerrena zonata TaxID=2478898 RepID=A0AAW0FQE5_9APHY
MIETILCLVPKRANVSFDSRFMNHAQFRDWRFFYLYSYRLESLVQFATIFNICTMHHYDIRTPLWTVRIEQMFPLFDNQYFIFHDDTAMCIILSCNLSRYTIDNG